MYEPFSLPIHPHYSGDEKAEEADTMIPTMPETTDQKPANETILMEDGSKIEFSPKKKVAKQVTISDQGTIIVKLGFRDGSVREFIFASDDKTYFKAAAHGYSQKLGDECAGLTDIADMVQAVDELGKRLENGDWTSKREAGSGSGGSILARALVELTKRPEETEQAARERVASWLSTKTQADKIALRNTEKLKPIVERLEAEKAAKSPKVDAGALLDELESI